ncbi:MAG TPA: hypothetical protein DD653_09695 [Marinilabiliales bacterium]|jgi:hypothetical protein|nr:hypothetical protein [Marinilabiliales bacterium]
MKRVYQAFLVFGAAIVLMGAFSANAQTREEEIKKMQQDREKFNKDYQEGFEKFVKERDEAIKKMDAEFQEFLKKEWTNYELFKAEQRKADPKPGEKPVYKTPVQKSPTQLKVVAPKKLEAGGEAPVLPVLAKSASPDYAARSASFAFYGANLNFEFDSKFITSFSGTVSEELISQKWEAMSQTNYNDLINQLISFKANMNLNDWGYYLLVKNASKQIGADENAEVFLEWFLLTKSNYKARLAFKASKLYLLLPSRNNIYGLSFFTFNNTRYYLINGKENDIFTYDKDFPEARIVMDLNLYKSINTQEDLKTKNLKFEYDGQAYNFDVKFNQNAINFYKDYPLSDIEVYFDATITPQTKESLTDALLPIIKGKPEEEAILFLLHFVQTAFDYQTDQQQFGQEKFFFPDELFFYPYSDCEDRSVLFAYLTKQMLGLDVIGLNYPGHMATAVKFSKEVVGDYISYKGSKYVVCDPTYVNAPIGQTMPQFAESNAIVVELRTSSDLLGRANKLWKLANKNGLYQGGNGKNIIFDDKNNAYMCGYFTGDIDFFGYKLSSSQNSNDIFIAKFPPSGPPEFVFKVGSAGNDIAYNIALGKDNSFYFTGSFNKDIKVGERTLHVKNNGDVFLAKCATDGTMQWVNQAGIEQLDSVNNMFVAHFDENGKKIWTRAYEESEDFTEYGITVDDLGKAFVTASLIASAGLDVSTKSYESYTAFDPVESLKKDYDKLLSEKYEPGIAGLFAVLSLINSTGNSLPGIHAQKALDQYNPSFRKKSPMIYENIGKIEFIKNSQGIVTIRTNDGKDVSFDAVKVSNNSKLKISMYNSGNAQIDILSGVQVGKAIIWYNLNYIRLFKENGDLLFDYDSEHTQKKVNMKKDILY